MTRRVKITYWIILAVGVFMKAEWSCLEAFKRVARREASADGAVPPRTQIVCAEI